MYQSVESWVKGSAQCKFNPCPHLLSPSPGPLLVFDLLFFKTGHFTWSSAWGFSSVNGMFVIANLEDFLHFDCDFVVYEMNFCYTMPAISVSGICFVPSTVVHLSQRT